MVKIQCSSVGPHSSDVGLPGTKKCVLSIDMPLFKKMVSLAFASYVIHQHMHLNPHSITKCKGWSKIHNDLCQDCRDFVNKASWRVVKVKAIRDDPTTLQGSVDALTCGFDSLTPWRSWRLLILPSELSIPVSGINKTIVRSTNLATSSIVYVSFGKEM